MPFPSPGDLPDPRSNPGLPHCEQTISPLSHQGSPLIAKFRLILKKVGKTNRPFRYDLYQIPNNYTVEVRNRLKGLDLKDRVTDELWTKVWNTVQETGIKTIPKKKKCKQENGCLRRP